MPVLPSLIERRFGGSAADGPRYPLVTPARIVATVVSALWRAVAAALAGLLLVDGIALLLWAVTPGSGSDTSGLLRGGMVAFAAAHFLPVSIGQVSVTLHPLLLTVVAVAVIASSAGRARPVRGRALEAVHGAVFVIAYAVLVERSVAVLSPAGAVQSGLLAPLGVAVVGALLGIAVHRTAWNRWWHRWAAPWAQVGVRGGAAATCLLLAAGALAVAIGLVSSFSDATAIGSVTAPSAGDGFGLLLLCLAFVPNAVVAGVGYISGAGFTLGGGSYSPLVTHPVELPAIPLLAAAPDGAEVSRSAVIAFAAPVAAGVLITVIACRMLTTRRDRLAGSAAAAVVAGLLVAGLAAVARGGVAGGPWESTGVPPVLAGGLVAGVLLVISGAWCGLSGLRTREWAPRRAHLDVVADTVSAADGVAGGVTDDVADGVVDDVIGGIADGVPDGVADPEDAPSAENAVDLDTVDLDTGDPDDGAGADDVGDLEPVDGSEPFPLDEPGPDPAGDDQPFPDRACTGDPVTDDGTHALGYPGGMGGTSSANDSDGDHPDERLSDAS